MIDYQQLFKAISGAYLIQDTKFNIIDANDNYLKLTLTKRNEIIGRNLFEVFPDTPDETNNNGMSNLRSSLETVLEYHKSHTMAVVQYDIQNSENGKFDRRFWCTTNSPILDDMGEVSILITQIEDVSEFVIESKKKQEESRFTQELLNKTNQVEAEIYRTTQLLTTREREIHGILEHAPIGMATVGLDGSFLEVNKSLCDILGYSKKELLKLSYLDLTHPQDILLEGNHLQQLLNDEVKSFKIEKRYIRKDGSSIHSQLTVSVLRNEDGVPIHCIAQIEDISERKIIEAKLAKYHKQNENLLTSLPVGIVVHAPDSTLTFCNPEAERIMGVNQKDVTGNTVVAEDWQILREDESHMPLDEFPVSRILNKKEHVKEMVIGFDRIDLGKIVWASINAYPEFDIHGELSHVVFTLIDVTDKKEAEKGLQQQAAALNRSNDALDEFAYIASHDLKEPLRGISNYSSYLLEDYGDKLDEEGKLQLLTLQKLSARLESLLNNLLRFSRISRIDLSFIESDLNQIVADKILLLETYLAENNATVKILNKLPSIICEQSRIGQVFQNLITNGIKYNTNKIKLIEINVQEKSNSYVFSIKDNGIGIAVEHYDTVFKIFRRLHGRDEYGGGTGAGLTLTKKIIERHGGEIWIDSEEGSGSTFYFSIDKNITAEA